MKAARKKRKPMAEMNVVPYIDVMLVLLIVFMVTAPLLMQGVQVELPKAPAEPMGEQNDEPLIVSVKADGSLYINMGDAEKARPLDDITERVRKANCTCIQTRGHKEWQHHVRRFDNKKSSMFADTGGNEVHKPALRQAHVDTPAAHTCRREHSSTLRRTRNHGT